MTWPMSVALMTVRVAGYVHENNVPSDCVRRTGSGGEYREIIASAIKGPRFSNRILKKKCMTPNLIWPLALNCANSTHR